MVAVAAAAPGINDPQTSTADQKLVQALQALCSQNDDVVRSCNDAVNEVLWVAASQYKAKESAAQDLGQAFSPEVLSVLKRNADQLLELKRQHIAEKQANKDNAKKLMWWTSSQAASSPAADNDLQADAVKHGRFKFFQLPGSGISSGANAALSSSTVGAASALKFWQTGIPAGAAVPRSFTDTPGTIDQPQKSLSALLFGRVRRSSSASSAAAASPGGRRVSGDTNNSWLSSYDAGNASRRASNRSSDSGNAVRTSSSFTLGQPPAAEQQQQGGVWASLASGEGPLSKSHSLLGKAGSQQEQMVGRSLECVTEDDREGHDSPQPGTGPTKGQHSLMAGLNAGNMRVQIAAPGRTTSPIESFSFGNRAEDEAHSPNFMRASVNSRLMEGRGAFSGAQVGGAAAGPLVRSSFALQSSRMDPFDVPEPLPQPFLEQMKLEDQVLKAKQATRESATATGLMGALRRSISGPARTGAATGAAGIAGAAGAAGMGAAAASGPAALAAGLASGRQSRQHSRGLVDASGAGPLTGGAGQLLEQQQPIAGDKVSFLDLDATRAYAMGVHQVLEGLEINMRSALSGSETDSKPQSPRAAPVQEGTAAAAAAGDVEPGMAAPAVKPAPAASAVSPEIEPADDQPEEQQPGSRSVSIMRELAPVQQLEEQRSQGKLPPPSPVLSPQSSGVMPPMPTAAGQQGGDRSLRPSSSAAGSRRQSHAASVGPSPTRSLPVMGQASIDILGRAAASSVNRQLVGGSPSNVRLTDVYSQTSGNLTPLAAGLSSIRRQSSSSHGNRPLPPRGPGTRTSPRSLLPEPSLPASMLPQTHLGPLAQQYTSTMRQAKKSAQAAGLMAASPRGDGGKSPAWAWQSLGLPTGPGAPLADPTIDPATYAAGNKYAASWGLVDSAMTAAAAAVPATAGGGLSRQNSAVAGSLSRQHSGAIQGQLSRQNSALSQRSPRYQQGQEGQQTPGTRQWQHSGAAGRYAGPASVTPTESQSPRSGRGTPGHNSNHGTAQRQQQPRSGAAQRTAGPVVPRGVEMQRTSEAGSDDSACYASAEETMSSASGYSGYASSNGGHTGGGSAGIVARGAWQQQQPAASGRSGQQDVGGRTGASPVPTPPAFLQRPTSAQAAVAAQWSPNKGASAIAQAPSYAMMHVSPEASGVNYGEGQGLQPRGLPAAYSNVSPRGTAGTSAQQAGASAGQQSNARASGAPSQQKQQQQAAAYAGGYNVHAAPSAPQQGSAFGRQPAATAGRRAPQHPQQQQQHVTTAVDMARTKAMRRSSSSSGGQQGYASDGAGALGSEASGINAGAAAGGYNSGYGTYPRAGSAWGSQVPLSGAAAGKAAYAQRR